MAHTVQDATKIEVATQTHLSTEIHTNQNGLQISTKVYGSNSFLATTVAVPIHDTAAVESSGVKVSVTSGSGPTEAELEEARLRKHINPQKHYGVHKTPGNIASANIHVDTPSFTSPSKPIQLHLNDSQGIHAQAYAAGSNSTANATTTINSIATNSPNNSGGGLNYGSHISGSLSVGDQEEARLLKHIKLDKGSNPTTRVGVGATPSASTTISGPGKALSGGPSANSNAGFNAKLTSNTAATNVPVWKLKQIEKEQEERERKEQERAAKLSKLSAPSLSLTAETPVSDVNLSANVHTGDAEINTTANFGNVRISDPEQEDMMLKKEEERLRKLMSGAGKHLKF